MGQIIQFVNNTTDTIIIQGVDADAFTNGSLTGALTCKGSNCLLTPGEGSAGIGDLSIFQLNGGADYAFSVSLISPASIEPSPFAGINQSNYTAKISSLTNGYSIVVIDTTIEALVIEIINNTAESIEIKGIALPLDDGALIAPLTNLSFSSGVYSLTASAGSATIGDLSIFETFQISSTNFIFDVVLGINLIMPDISAPLATQGSYTGGITQNQNQYTITINSVSTAESIVIVNNTQDSVIVQGINQSAFTSSSFQGSFSCSGGNCLVLPGTGSAVIANPVPFQGGFQLNGGADFAFALNLNGSLSAIEPSPFSGVNQSNYAASIIVDGTQYIITISETPLNPTIQFINNTSKTIELQSSLDSGAFTNCLNGLSWNGTNYLQTTGVGSGEIGDIPSNFTVSVNSLIFTITIGSSPTILPASQSGYGASINVLGNLYTIVIQAINVIPPGPGTKFDFTIAGSLSELLFSGEITEMNYAEMIREESTIEAQFTTTSTGIATLQTSPSIGPLNPSSPNFLTLDSKKSSYGTQALSGNVMVQLASTTPPGFNLYSQNVIAEDFSASPKPFLFPLNLTGTSTTVQIEGPNGVNPVSLSSPSINISASYVFTVTSETTPPVSSSCTGTLSMSGFAFTFQLPMNLQQIPKGMSGLITITDTTQSSQTITLNINADKFDASSGKASLAISGNFYGQAYVINSAEIDSGVISGVNPCITIPGNLTGGVPSLFYNSNITGTINLLFQ